MEKEEIKQLIKRFEKEYSHDSERKFMKPIKKVLCSAEGILLIAGISEWFEDKLNK